jgi:hypothetical protein
MLLFSFLGHPQEEKRGEKILPSIFYDIRRKRPALLKQWQKKGRLLKPRLNLIAEGSPRALNVKGGKN